MTFRTRFQAAGVLAGLLVLGILFQVANANMVYNFIPDADGDGPYTRVLSGRLMVTDAAYRTGSVTVNYSMLDQSLLDAAHSPILLAGLIASNTYETTIVEPRSHFFQWANDGGYSLQANLTFQDDGTLAGDLFISGDYDNLKAKGAGDAWQVYDVKSDYFDGTGHCTGSNFGCFASMGHWQLDDSTISNDVPAPPAWPLLAVSALGIFGLIGLKRFSDRSRGQGFKRRKA
jgi:hypothetical protein